MAEFKIKPSTIEVNYYPIEVKIETSKDGFPIDATPATNQENVEAPSNWDDIQSVNKPEDNATKREIFTQDDAPTKDFKEGDLWFDTDDNNHIYVANSALAWVSQRDGTIVTAAGTANWSEVVDDDSNKPESNADVTGDHEADVSLANLGEKSFASLTAGTITSKVITLATDNADVKIQAGKTDFGQDTTDGFILGRDYSDSNKAKLEITGGTITGGIIQTATTGQRVAIGSNKIEFWDSSNNSCGTLLGLSEELNIAGANVYIVASLKIYGILQMEDYPIYGNIFPNKWCLNFDGWGPEDTTYWRGWRETGTGGNQANNALQFGGYLLETGAVTNNYVQTYAAVNADWALNWDQNPSFQVFAKYGSTTSQDSFMGMGDTTNGFGFYVEDGTLSAIVWTAGSEYKTTITGITLTNFNTYEAIYNYGTDIKFYVNGVLKHTQTTNLPTTESTTIFIFYILTSSDATRKLYIRNLRIIADN